MSAALKRVQPEDIIRCAINTVQVALRNRGYGDEAAQKITANVLAEMLGRQIGRVDCTTIQFETMLLDYGSKVEDSARNTIAEAKVNHERR